MSVPLNAGRQPVDENIKVRTFSIDLTEALLATLKNSLSAQEAVRSIMYKRVDDFIAEAVKERFDA